MTIYLVDVVGLYSDFHRFHRFQEFLNHMERASQLQCTKDVQMLGVPDYETVRPLSMPHASTVTEGFHI